MFPSFTHVSSHISAACQSLPQQLITGVTTLTSPPFKNKNGTLMLILRLFNKVSRVPMAWVFPSACMHVECLTCLLSQKWCSEHWKRPNVVHKLFSSTSSVRFNCVVKLAAEKGRYRDCLITKISCDMDVNPWYFNGRVRVAYFLNVAGCRRLRQMVWQVGKDKGRWSDRLWERMVDDVKDCGR